MTKFVGSRSMQVQDRAKNISFPVLMMYPTQVPSSPVAFGPYSIDVSPEAPIDGDSLPVVIISHGGGGSHLLYRSLAAYLAKEGYLVAMPEHPGNNRNNNALDGTIENVENRPRHIQLVIDAVCADAQFKDRVQSTNAAIIGHSLGGYTALAVAGGKPCAGLGQMVEVTPDDRVKSLVLMAPATNWYVLNDSLKDVRTPILLLSAEHDPITPRWQAQLVLDLIPNRAQVTFKVIENAGHFSFLTPFPPAMMRPGFAPAIDPDGFDRQRFHVQLNEEILTFLNKTLRDS